MANRADFKKLCQARLKSAKILHQAGDYDAAGYLLGYVVEFALKAAICKRLRLVTYPITGDKNFDVFATHSFDRLLVLAGLSSDIDYNKNEELFQNWSILTQDWAPEVRYNLKSYDKLIIDSKINALEYNPNGFFVWIKKRW